MIATPRMLIVLALALAGAADARAGEPGAEAKALPERLVDLLDAKDEGGKAVVSEQSRKYFNDLSGHGKTLIGEAVTSEMITAPGHLATLLALDLTNQKLELAMRDNCLLCHSDPESQSPGTLLSLDPARLESPAHMNLGEFASDTHFRHSLSCSGCHGGDPSSTVPDHQFPPMWPASPEARARDRSWIPAFCSRCHSNPATMRRYNPALPTDQLAKYQESRHGQLVLGKKDSRAAQCVSCHGNHGIRPATSPNSRVHPKRVPDMCGSCHASAEIMAGLTLADGRPIPTDQLAQYRTSVHGRALLDKGDLGAPACNDCHGNHAPMPPEVASIAQICRTCHVGNGSLFDGSSHKQAFAKHGWPECETCHGNHAIAATADEMLATTEGALCGDCHRKHAPENPECIATADHFLATITSLATAQADYTAAAEHLAERGLDVAPLQDDLAQLADVLKQSRSAIHAFSRSDFDQVAGPGMETATTMAKRTTAAHDEYRWRTRGLFASIVAMAFLALMVFLKVRALDRRQ